MRGDRRMHQLDRDIATTGRLRQVHRRHAATSDLAQHPQIADGVRHVVAPEVGHQSIDHGA